MNQKLPDGVPHRIEPEKSRSSIRLMGAILKALTSVPLPPADTEEVAIFAAFVRQRFHVALPPPVLQFFASLLVYYGRRVVIWDKAERQAEELRFQMRRASTRTLSGVGQVSVEAQAPVRTDATDDDIEAWLRSQPQSEQIEIWLRQLPFQM